jgi:hypothetical protein
MAGACATAARSGGDVYCLFHQNAGVILRFEDLVAGCERLVDATPGGAQQLAGGRFVFLRQAADFAVGKAERRLLAGGREADGLEFFEGGCAGNGW